MSAHDVKLFGDAIAASRLETRFARADGAVRCCGWRSRICFPAGSRWSPVFGADSAVLLHMIVRDRQGDAGRVRRHRPAFPRDARLSRPLGRAARPDQHRRRRAGRGDAGAPRTRRNSCSPPIPTAAAKSARSRRWRRAATPMTPGSPAARASRPPTARALPLFEAEGERVKVNPLVGWSAGDLLAYIKQHDLPPHPLVAKGFPVDRLPALHQPWSSRAKTRAPAAGAASGKTGMRHPRRHARRGRKHLMALWRDGAFADDEWTTARRRRAGRRRQSDRFAGALAARGAKRSRGRDGRRRDRRRQAMRRRARRGRRPPAGGAELRQIRRRPRVLLRDPAARAPRLSRANCAPSATCCSTRSR